MLTCSSTATRQTAVRDVCVRNIKNMITGNQKILYNAIGAIQIIFSASLLFTILFYLPGYEGTVVIPEWIRSLTTNTLLMVSGIGILMRKKLLFLCSFCVYPMLILRRFDLVYVHIRSEKVGDDLDALYKAIIVDSLFQIVCAFLLISIMLFLFQGKCLSEFKNVTKNVALIYMAAGSLVYMLFFRI